VLIEHEMLARAMEEPAASPGLINPDDQRFFNPPDMIGEVQASLRDAGQMVPGDQVAISRVVLDSLALRCSQVVEHLEVLIGGRVPGIHIVGGGSRNEYLNQATADACGRPVLAGPVEATSLGNLMVQAIASGRFASLADARAFVKRHLPGRPYTPRARSRWQDLRAVRPDHRRALSGAMQTQGGLVPRLSSLSALCHGGLLLSTLGHDRLLLSALCHRGLLSADTAASGQARLGARLG
jgi:sugar (pentulose or hexulose) kinase